MQPVTEKQALREQDIPAARVYRGENVQQLQ